MTENTQQQQDDAAKGTRYMVLYRPLADDPATPEPATPDKSTGWFELGYYRAWDGPRAEDNAIAEHKDKRGGFREHLHGEGVLVRAVAAKSWTPTEDLEIHEVYTPEPELRRRPRPAPAGQTTTPTPEPEADQPPLSSITGD